MVESSTSRIAMGSLLAPLAVLVAASAHAHGCAAHGDPLAPESDAPITTPEPATPERAMPERVAPQPASVDPPRIEPSPRAADFRARRDPPKGAPKVTSTVAFDILAPGVAMPRAEDNNELDWFLGSSSPNPSWSPDGHRIAHYDGRCISVHDDAGRLVNSLRPRAKDVECRGPRWAPNGRSVVASHRFHGPGIVLDVFGKKERALRSAEDGGLWSLSWLGDGEHLVGRIHQSGAVLVAATGKGAAIPLVTDEVPELQGYFPSFAPGGRHFARVLGEWQGAGELEVAAFSLEGAATIEVKDPWDTRRHRAKMGKRVALVPGPILEYAWSRDGERIAAVRARSWYPGYGNFDYGTGELVIIDVNSGEMRVAALSAKNPTWSPDGKHLAFESADGGIFALEAARPQLGAWPMHPTGIEPQWSGAGHAILTLDPAKHQGVVLLLEQPAP
jgi:dipeptidyl aminopeptidase/acylaminoacyl peptidase